MDEYVAAAQVLAGSALAVGGLDLAAELPFLVEPVEHIGHPGASGFKKGDAEGGEQLEDSLQGEAGHLDDLRDREADGVALDEPGVGDVFGSGVAAVNGDGGVEVLGLGEEGVVLLPADKSVAHGRGECPRKPELRHRSAQLLGGLLGVDQGHDGNRAEPVVDLQPVVVDEGVVGTGHGDGVFGVDHHGVGKEGGGIEVGLLDTGLVHDGKPVCGEWEAGRAVRAQGAAHGGVHAGLLGNQGVVGVDVATRIGLPGVEIGVVGRRHVGSDDLFGLVDVAVGVDNLKWRSHVGPPGEGMSRL